MNVHWTENAIGKLIGIYEYIAVNSPRYAKRMVDRLQDGPNSIERIEPGQPNDINT